MERAANPWDRFYRYQEAPWRGERQVNDLLPLLGEGPVLELGCGNGKALKPLLRAGVEVVALDISWHALGRLDHDRRVLADAVALPFATGTFSAVLDLHCTGHLPAAGRAAALREAARVLAPGGHLIQERLAPEDLRAAQGADAGEPHLRVLQDGRMTHFGPQEVLVAEATAAGFVHVASMVVQGRQRIRGGHAIRSSNRLVLRRQKAD